MSFYGSRVYRCFLTGVTFLLSSVAVFSQGYDSSKQAQKPIKIDSTIIARLKKVGEDEAKRSIIIYKTASAARKQQELIEDLVKTTHSAKEFLKSGIDTLGIHTELNDLNDRLRIAGDAVFTHTGTYQTYRNLATTYMILRELLNISLDRKIELDGYQKHLAEYRYRIDSLYSDSILYSFSSDSAEVLLYIKKIMSISHEIFPTDSALKLAITHVADLQVQVNAFVYELEVKIQEVEEQQQALSGKLFHREFANLGGPLGFERPFREIVDFSNAKRNLTLFYYSKNHPGMIVVVLLLILIMTFFLGALKEKVLQEKNLPANNAEVLVLRYPFLSAAVIVLSLTQFIFPDPPFVFNCLFWVLSAVSLTIIFWKFISRYWMIVWLTMLIFFFIACSDNLILQASRTERWGILFLALAGALSGSVFLVLGHKQELREKYMIYFIVLVVILEVASVLANIYGRYNLAKSLMTSGYFNVIIGILFLWTIRLINECLSLASRLYTIQDKKLFYINFERVGGKVPRLLYVFLIIGWLVLIGRIFYAFKLISEPLRQFFYTERTIGDYSFTFNKVFIFFLILFISVFISRIVSFFASDMQHSYIPAGTKKKAGIGSWLLLIRVGIISLGLFLALAAAGFPMDRITIILGALGVGIGFGFQTLVNNLVSGLIIAFEKPVNVGDVVEIAGQAGTMKSIGFRSSIISKWEGADVVIPNGDLLNAHLVNWTLGGNKKRIEIKVGIAYGTNLEKAKLILQDLLKSNEKILRFPEPVVHFEEFSNSSIDMVILFWVSDLKQAQPVKSEMISAVDTAFKNNGIVIPFPQQDVYLRPLNQ